MRSCGSPASFTRALVSNVAGLVIALGLALLVAMIWQSAASTEEAARQEIGETLNRAVGRLQILVHAAEMTAESAERVARTTDVKGPTLRPTLENLLAAFEQRPELSYLGIVLPETGEYGNLERTAAGKTLLWLFPGNRADDPIVRSFLLTDEGFVQREAYPTDGYDPRSRPFYQAALQGPPGGTWMPAYQWILHSSDGTPLWGFSYVKALRDDAGRLMSVLDADFDVPALNGFLQSLAAEYRVRLHIVELGASPHLIGAPGVDREPLPLPADLAPLAGLSGDTFVDRMELEGERRWVAARRMDLKGGLSWLVIASRTATFIEAPLRRQLLQVLGMGLAIALGLVLASVRIARRFGRPLAELEQRLAAIGQHEPGTPAASPASTTDGFRETQLLGEALDRMEVAISQQALAKEQQVASLALKGAIFDFSSAAIFSLDRQLNVIEWNAAAERLFGKERDEVLGRAVGDVVATPDGSADWAAIQGTAGTGSFRFLGAHGPFDADLRLVTFIQEGREVRTLILNDVSERKQIERQLRQERDYADAVLNSLPGVFYHYDENVHLTRWNRNLERISGYTAEELAGADPMLFFADEEKALVADRIGEVFEKGESSVEADYVLKDGRRIPYLFTGVRFEYDGRRGFVGVGYDITERKQAEKRIRHLAMHDDLTDLPNRNLIQDRIAQAIAHSHRTGRLLALLYLDLDRFKVVNDGYGHLFGDAVLKATGHRLVESVRDSDTVARLGGDEFLILLADLNHPADADVVARKIVESLDSPIVVQGRKIHLSGSIGVSVFPFDGEAADTLIDNADMAMYRAKELGRNTYQFFTREMSQEIQRRVDLEIKLRGAASAGQLQLAYQPKVSLKDGCISGCEALLRWHHPELGVVSPGQFIPIAEDSGLIVPIGDWVLRTACMQARAWMDAGLPPLCVAVNISVRQFLQQDVVAWVARTLQETGLPPAWLELELTESLIAEDIEQVTATTNQLKSMGVKLSIDDFGTGYSSLSYLKRFRVDTLKIDQSFVRNMLSDIEDETIVLAVISLAHNLKFRVIAEGVETEQHCRFLQLNGCDEIQGYYFSKPVTAAELEAMLRDGRQLPLRLDSAERR
ncbi:bifunctional diguanylate cyclase/phosphodiesterase [Thauera sinica]|uniref:EAL domain-containing protein n=1 Tax=Thauera sinica TaxID=2665146 RepID=A0ABW1AMR0_9RHOO|nr:EAL domain-containing protein [Thauera sp. K11]ATE60626.1 GGDEF domain-containing protein [Thauera sp. K11]